MRLCLWYCCTSDHVFKYKKSGEKSIICTTMVLQRIWNYVVFPWNKKCLTEKMRLCLGSCFSLGSAFTTYFQQHCLLGFWLTDTSLLSIFTHIECGWYHYTSLKPICSFFSMKSSVVIQSDHTTVSNRTVCMALPEKNVCFIDKDLEILHTFKVTHKNLTWFC